MNGVNDDCKRHAPKPHDEGICHATGEQRQQIIKKIKCLLRDFDNRECVLPEISTEQKPFRGVYPPSQKVTQRAPLITSTGTQEIRLTSDRKRVADDPPDLIYKAAPNLLPNGLAAMNTPGRKKSVELKGGVFYGSCFCVKRNGLQADCPRSDCMGKPECLALSPGPCCQPALAYYGKSAPIESESGSTVHRCEYTQSKRICCCCHEC